MVGHLEGFYGDFDRSFYEVRGNEFITNCFLTLFFSGSVN